MSVDVMDVINLNDNACQGATSHPTELEAITKVQSFRLLSF